MDEDNPIINGTRGKPFVSLIINLLKRGKLKEEYIRKILDKFLNPLIISKILHFKTTKIIMKYIRRRYFHIPITRCLPIFFLIIKD